MPIFKATIEVFVETGCAASACDAVAEIMREHIREHAPRSAMIDWNYAPSASYPEQIEALPDYVERRGPMLLEQIAEAGYEIRHDMHGFYGCTQEEAAHEDEGNPSAGFDGRLHYVDIESAAYAVLENAGYFGTDMSV